MRVNKILVLGLLLFSPFWVMADNMPEIKWHNATESESLNKAMRMVAASELPVIETVLSSDIDITIKNGIATTRITKIVYLPTFKEANDSGTKYINWDQAVENLTLKEATVVNSDGSHRRMDPDNIRIRNNDTYNTFTNSKQVVVPLSGLVDKSITVLEYELKTQLSDKESFYADIFYPVGFLTPVKSFGLSVTTPDGFELSWANSHPDIECKSDATELVCSGKDLDVFPYESTVQWRDELPHIMLAKKSSWPEVVQHIKRAFDQSDYLSPDVIRYAQELAADLDVTEDKIHAFHEFASRGIRYVSMSELGNRITPHPFNHVISNLFGDCKDKSALLVGLLKSIGIDAVPVLVATERRDPSVLQVASAAYFDHMVVCFEYDGKQFCLDPTDNNTHWRDVSSWVQGRVSLPLTDNAKPATLPLKTYKWVMNYETVSNFSSDASVVENQTRNYFGVYASSYRANLSGLSEQARDEWLVSNYHNNVSDLVVPTFTVPKLGEMSNTLKVESTANYEPYVSDKEDLNLNEQDSWIRAEIISSKLTGDKKYGTWMDGSYIVSTLIYDLSKVWSVTRLPAQLEFDDDGISLHRSVELSSSGQLVIATKFKLKSQFVEPADVDGYNAQLDILKEASNIHLVGVLKSKNKVD